MLQKKFALCSATAILALAVACSESPQSPAAPSGTPAAGGEAAADGSTLKVSAPAPQSPVNGAQPQTLTLTAGTSSALYASGTPALTYEFQILTTGGTVIGACTTVANPSGNAVSASPRCAIDADANYRWRVRARLGTAAGPWGETTFRAPVGGYISGNEVYDPLYSGASVGNANGVSFTPQGARFNGHESFIEYELDPNLQAGEISVMVTGIDEGNPGDKTKIFSMQEGNGNDLTDNDYRMTVEKRGRDYSTPGATTWRIIMGEADEHAGRIFDGARLGVAYSDENWYFWQFTWGNGRAELIVREDGPNGPVIYNTSRGTGGFPYRPVPHYAYLGAKIGRNGPIDASIPGAIYKNLWISSRPRPAFPNE